MMQSGDPDITVLEKLHVQKLLAKLQNALLDPNRLVLLQASACSLLCNSVISKETHTWFCWCNLQELVITHC